MALNKTVPPGCVEPLHHTLFSAQLSALLVRDVRHLPGVMRGGGAWKKKLQVPVRNTPPTNAATCWHKTGSCVQRVCDVLRDGRGPGGAARRMSLTGTGYSHWSLTPLTHTAAACRRAKKGFAW